MGRGIGVSDEEWSVIAALLPAEQGPNYHPSHENRKYFEGMLWIARSGAQWRELPSEYGKWNSVYKCFRRWALNGVWDAMLQALANRTQAEARPHQDDDTVLQAFHDAADVIGRIRTRRLWANRERSFPLELMPAQSTGADQNPPGA